MTVEIKIISTHRKKRAASDCCEGITGWSKNGINVGGR